MWRAARADRGIERFSAELLRAFIEIVGAGRVTVIVKHDRTPMLRACLPSGTAGIGVAGVPPAFRTPAFAATLAGWG